MRLAVLHRPRGVPGAQHAFDRGDELVPGVTRDRLAGFAPHQPVVLRDELLEVVGIEGADIAPAQDGVEGRPRHPEDDGRVALEKATPHVEPEARVLLALGEAAGDVRVDADVEHGLQHAGHRGGRTRADRDQKRRPGIAEAKARGRLEVRDLGAQQPENLLAQATLGLEAPPDLGREREARRDREPHPGHLGDGGALPPSQRRAAASSSGSGSVKRCTRSVTEHAPPRSGTSPRVKGSGRISARLGGEEVEVGDCGQGPRDAAEQAQPVVADLRILVHHEDLVEEAVDRLAELLGDQRQGALVVALLHRRLQRRRQGREALRERALCLFGHPGRVRLALGGVGSDVVGTLEGDREGLVGRKLAELLQRLETRRQIAQRAAVPRSQAGVHQIGRVALAVERAQPAAEELVEGGEHLLLLAHGLVLRAVAFVCGAQRAVYVDVDRALERAADDAERSAAQGEGIGRARRHQPDPEAADQGVGAVGDGQARGEATDGATSSPAPRGR